MALTRKSKVVRINWQFNRFCNQMIRDLKFSLYGPIKLILNFICTIPKIQNKKRALIITNKHLVLTLFFHNIKYKIHNQWYNNCVEACHI